ncbi:MAG: sulfatase-like hydrolase/transferase [Opitutaceae bacterium]
MGKWRLGDELFAQHGFQEWVSIEDGYSQYYSPGRDRNARSDYYHHLVSLGHTPNTDENRFSREYAVQLPVELGKPAFQAGRAIDFLRRHRASPFILHVNYLEPHTPYFSPLRDRYEDDPCRPDETYFTTNDPGFPVRYQMKQGSFARDGEFSSEARVCEIRRHYHANVTVVDRSVGLILTELERLGLADSTIVVFTSGHGDQMSAHRLWHKEVMFQESLRVPYLVRVPGARGGRVVKDPVSHIDIVPTMLELPGARAPESLPGQSLGPLLRDEIPAPRRPLGE